MKYISIILILTCTAVYGQLSIEEASNLADTFQVGIYDYHQKFIGYNGYGAPVILTRDGGAALFGDQEDDTGVIGLFIKVDNQGNEVLKKEIRPEFSEIESQSVIQDQDGNYLLFILSYDYSRYRGGSERVVCLDQEGVVLWDKTYGSYGLENNPVIAYIHRDSDGRIALRGHIVTGKPEEGKDPVYHFWNGWLDKQGNLVQLTGEIIDWSDPDWEKYFSPD